MSPARMHGGCSGCVEWQTLHLVPDGREPS